MKLSLRARLLLILLIGLAATSALTISWTSVLARSELAEVYDRNMQQLAWSLDDQYDPSITPPQGGIVAHPSSTDPDSDFISQIRTLDGKLLYTARPDLTFPALTRPGYGYTDYQGQRWRHYVYRGQDLQIQVYQSDVPRRQTIVAILERFLIPSLLQLPLLGAIIWFGVQLGLRPLSRLTRDIEARGTGDMSPLANDDLPPDIQPLATALNKLLDRLGSALTIQRRFTADAAHELRTPLTAIQIQLDLVKRSRNREEREAAIDTLSEGIRRSTHVVRQLLQLARQEPDGAHGAFRTINMNDLVTDVVERLRPQAVQKGINFKWVPAVALADVFGSRDDLKVLFENLIDNALRYTPPGAHVEVLCESGAGSIIVTVLDGGPGIAREHREKVFDRFYRVESGKTTGTGLGLAIAKAIVHRHGARIELEDGIGPSGTGLGVRVTFERGQA